MIAGKYGTVLPAMREQMNNMKYKTFSFKIFEKSKYHTGEVTHSTKARSLDKAVENFYPQMARFGFTKEDIKRELI